MAETNKVLSRPLQVGLVPMGPVQAVQMAASSSVSSNGGFLAQFFRHSPSVRAVLISTTMLTAGMMAGPAVAQVSDRPERIETQGITRRLFESRLLGKVEGLHLVADGVGFLAVGDSGPQVEAVQVALMQLGVSLRGGADGDFGGATVDAVYTYRARAGLPYGDVVDGSFIRTLDADLVVAERLRTPRFRSSPTFLEIAMGRATLGLGTTDKKTTEILQATLYGLGEDLGSSFVDADFGGATVAALESFQAKSGLVVSGRLDARTLEALDGAASIQLDSLMAATIPAGSKKDRYEIVGDLVRNRLYVVDKTTDQPIATYLTSPGKAGNRTLGDEFTVRRTLVRKTWYPTPSMTNARPIGPGLKNPMGLMKFDLGRYYQYIHGTPFSVRSRLGTPASHGCLRMSTENILEMGDYIEPGTKVELTRDREESERLATAAAAAGIVDRPLDAGRARLAAFLAGELGRDEALENEEVVRR